MSRIKYGLRFVFSTGMFAAIVFCCCSNGYSVPVVAGHSSGAHSYSCVQEELDPNRIRAEIHDVMNDADFRAVRDRAEVDDSEPTFLDRMLDDLARQSEDTSSSSTGRSRTGSSSGTADMFSKLILLFIILAIFAVLALIVFVIAKTVNFSSDKKSARPLAGAYANPLAVVAPPGETAVNEYERRALEMAASGDYGGAVRELLLGSMSWIERKGLIRFRAGLTNRDYLRAVWRLDSQRTAFDNNSLEFEKIYFGRRSPTQSVFQSCLDHFRGAFHDESVITNSSI